MTHTQCMNCNCMLSGTRAIEEHLKYSHGLQVKLNNDSHHRAYCNGCHKYLGNEEKALLAGSDPVDAKKDDKHVDHAERRKALEKHLFEQHEIYMVEESQN